ncbi:MAG: NADH-quinone oxidoreductase subunit C [Deltaproteobacteria bacterium]|jgi:NADH-quinone oxidoreductase subunit C|nr:NADH-quinone oxidoreductase subunit C [Deltaproteobacteria bacterium]
MTEIEKLIQRFKQAGAYVISNHNFKKEGLTVSAVIDASQLKTLAKDLYRQGYSLLDLSTLEVKEGFLLTYHFDKFEKPGRIALRVLLEGPGPIAPSLYEIFQGAEWHERESHDFFGVKFAGNPNLIPLLLPDDFQAPPPLRKNPESLTSLAALKLFGSYEILSSRWETIINSKVENIS